LRLEPVADAALHEGRMAGHADLRQAARFRGAHTPDRTAHALADAQRLRAPGADMADQMFLAAKGNMRAVLEGNGRGHLFETLGDPVALLMREEKGLRHIASRWRCDLDGARRQIDAHDDAPRARIVSGGDGHLASVYVEIVDMQRSRLGGFGHGV